MYLNSAEKDLVSRGLESLKDNLEKSRLLFDVGSVQRERVENKFSMIFDIKNKLHSDFTLTSNEKALVFECLENIKGNLDKNRSFFDVGTADRENLEKSFSLVVKIKNDLEQGTQKSSLDSLIDIAKQRSQMQSNPSNIPQRNNDLTL